MTEANDAAFGGFLNELPDAAGSAILPYFRTRLDIEDKGGRGYDPVTAADRAGEAAMRALIGARFPEHGILGEEYGRERDDAEHVWVLDPIDGTRSFISGVPTWGVLIGLMRNGRAVRGMMAQPFTGERYSGDGASARYDGPDGGRSLAVRACPDIASATLYATAPDMSPGPDEAPFARVSAASRLTRFGADCYAYCMLAAGLVDLVVEAKLQPYDIVALVPLIEGAGGIVTTWDGERPEKAGRIVAAGDRRVHAAALELLNKG